MLMRGFSDLQVISEESIEVRHHVSVWIITDVLNYKIIDLVSQISHVLEVKIDKQVTLQHNI